MEAVQALSSYELERGKPMPSRNHSVAQLNLIAAFLPHRKTLSIFPELTLELDGTKHTPDISVYTKRSNDWQHDEIKVTEPPLLAVEILSPKQAMPGLIAKAEAYLEAGVKSCWIVQPAIEAISVLQPGEKLKTYLEGEVEDPATRITVEVEEIFR